jgi:hypothetical protein
VAAVNVANDCVARIDQRSEQLKALVERFAEIGVAAREINELTGVLRAPEDEGGGDRLAQIDRVLERMQAVRDDARQLCDRARDEGFEDITRQADGMVQQIASIHNKLKLYADKLR